MHAVLVAGGRTYNDKKTVFDTLDRVHRDRPIECIIHGACPNSRRRSNEIVWSADMLAEAWAKEREVPYLGFPAKWKTGTAGKGEGPIRNQQMADVGPAYAVLFPGGAGTASMKSCLERANIPFEEVK